MCKGSEIGGTGDGQKVKYFACNATRVARNCERVGYATRKCAESRARERGWGEWIAELGAGDALVHSQRSHDAARVFRSAGQSAVPAFEGRVHFSNVSVAAFTCPLQTNFSDAIENCDGREKETVVVCRRITVKPSSWLEGGAKERGPVGSRVASGRG